MGLYRVKQGGHDFLKNVFLCILTQASRHQTIGISKHVLASPRPNQWKESRFDLMGVIH